MKYLLPAIIAIALFALAGCGGSKSTTELPATRNAPTFSTAAANEFVKNTSQTANDYVDAIKNKNVKRIKALTPKLAEIQKTSLAAAKGLTPAEAGKLQGWVNALMRQVRNEAMRTAAPPAAKKDK